MLKKALIATALITAVAAGTATAASAHPGSHGYKRVVTVQQCIGGSKYLVRKTRSGRVLSRSRIGRCYTVGKHHAHKHHANWRAKRAVKRIFRKAFK